MKQKRLSEIIMNEAEKFDGKPKFKSRITLFKTNVNHLQKVRNQLKLSQTMSYRQVILGEGNTARLNEVIRELDNAIALLRSIN